MSLSLPRRVLLGGGTINQLGSLLKSLNLKKPLIVTDPYNASTEGLRRATRSLGEADVRGDLVFQNTVPDPTTESVDVCVGEIKKHADVDVLVAFGGGSPMDTAKAAAVLAVHGGRMRDYKAPRLTDTPGLPVICVPTTAGTGSEATRFTIVTDSQTDEKMLCAGLAYLPLAAVVDYELTLSMPYRLTADTGIDAFCHAMEAYVSKRRNGFADGLALTAIHRIANSLRNACDKPDDRVAREQMMLAATEAGMAFSNSSVTLIHGMSRPIGALFHVPHGLSNAMLAPSVTAFSIHGAVERYADVARAAQFCASTGVADIDAAEACVKGLRDLTRDLKVPRLASWKGLEDTKRFDAIVKKMADDALASGSPLNNPVVPTASQIEGLYRSIYSAPQA